MRVFKKYAPKQIAKYVVSFFKGKFQIEGAGVFEFDSGKVVVSIKMDPNMIKICKEINEQVTTMSNRVDVEKFYS